MLGYSVLLSDVDIVTLQNPFENLHRDVDVEGLSDGFDERSAYGWNDGIDDPSMAGGGGAGGETAALGWVDGWCFPSPNPVVET